MVKAVVEPWAMREGTPNSFSRNIYSCVFYFGSSMSNLGTKVKLWTKIVNRNSTIKFCIYNKKNFPWKFRLTKFSPHMTSMYQSFCGLKCLVFLFVCFFVIICTVKFLSWLSPKIDLRVLYPCSQYMGVKYYGVCQVALLLTICPRARLVRSA